MAELKRQYDEKLQQKEELRKKSDFMEMMLDRASQLVSGLIGEKERWENTVTVRSHAHLHVLLAASRNSQFTPPDTT